MEHGGQRDNAGRKRGSYNLLTTELRERINARQLIQFLQELAAGKVEGASIAERKDAAVALLRKVLPDCRFTEIEHRDNSLTGEDYKQLETFLNENTEAAELVDKIIAQTLCRETASSH